MHWEVVKITACSIHRKAGKTLNMEDSRLSFCFRDTSDNWDNNNGTTGFIQHSTGITKPGLDPVYLFNIAGIHCSAQKRMNNKLMNNNVLFRRDRHVYSNIKDSKKLKPKRLAWKCLQKTLIDRSRVGTVGHASFHPKEGGTTPHHAHPWPHINYIISGRGTLCLDGKDTSLGEGSVAYVPSNTKHQFKNDAKEDFVFICIVPEEGDV